MAKKKIVASEDAESVLAADVPVQGTPVQASIAPLDLSLNREDLDAMVEKINEIIDYLNG